MSKLTERHDNLNIHNNKPVLTSTTIDLLFHTLITQYIQTMKRSVDSRVLLNELKSLLFHTNLLNNSKADINDSGNGSTSNEYSVPFASLTTTTTAMAQKLTTDANTIQSPTSSFSWSSSSYGFDWKQLLINVINDSETEIHDLNVLQRLLVNECRQRRLHTAYHLVKYCVYSFFYLYFMTCRFLFRYLLTSNILLFRH